MRTAWVYMGRGLFWVSWPLLFVYLRFSTRTRVLVVVDDNVLVVRGWLSDGHWMLPGGGLHRGELPKDGAVRETYEETALQLHPSQLSLLAKEASSYRGLRTTLYYFKADLAQITTIEPQPREIVATRWVPLAELAILPTHPEIGRALHLLANR